MYGDSNTKIQVNDTIYDIEVKGEIITLDGKDDRRKLK